MMISIQYGFIDRPNFLGRSPAKRQGDFNVITHFPPVVTPPTQVTTTSKQSIVIENVTFSGLSAAKKAANLLVLSPQLSPDYLLIGLDTYGWPEPDPPFVLPMPGYAVRLTSYIPFNPAVDIQHLRPFQYFDTPPDFLKSWTLNPIIRDTPPFVPPPPYVPPPGYVPVPNFIGLDWYAASLLLFELGFEQFLPPFIVPLGGLYFRNEVVAQVPPYIASGPGSYIPPGIIFQLTVALDNLLAATFDLTV
jgi:hypothetical protein